MAMPGLARTLEGASMLRRKNLLHRMSGLASWCLERNLGLEVQFQPKGSSAAVTCRACQSLSMVEPGRRFVVIVEKDAVFQRLMEDGFAEHLGAILVTAKGMPDAATRAFLHCLCRALPHLEQFAGTGHTLGPEHCTRVIHCLMECIAPSCLQASSVLARGVATFW